MPVRGSCTAGRGSLIRRFAAIRARPHLTPMEAKLNGLDPEIYLHNVLERIADHPINRIVEFLPWNVSIVTL